jgi:hypothetical protein
MQRFIYSALFLLLCVHSGNACRAGIRGTSEYSWMAISSDGKYIYAGVSKSSVEEQLELIRGTEFNDIQEQETLVARIRDIHERFPLTGMYLNNGSRTPLWTLNTWVDNGVIIRNGEQLVSKREGAFGNAEHSEIAHIFNRDGLVRDLEINDVLSQLELTVRGYLSDEFVACNWVRLDPSGEVLQMGTNFGDVLEVRLVDGRTTKQ